MDEAEFDRFADEYQSQHRAAVAITGEEPEFFHEYKVKVLAELLAKRGSGVRRILDFGAGIGNSIPHFRRHLPQAELSCADVSKRSLDLAESRFGAAGTYKVIENATLPVDNSSQDVTFSACVFHHIPHEEHVRWLQELLRVTRPGGLLAIFEHNPLNPLTVRAVRNCPFDENAHLIRSGEFAKRFRAAGWVGPQTRYHLFFPNALASLRPLEQNLSWLPLGAQYSILAQKQA